jgi:lactate dehydrogenase-like 2-hydroxyacid dehydrogenase
MTADTLVVVPLSDEDLAIVTAARPVVHLLRPTVEQIASVAPGIRAVWTNGTIGLKAEAIDALPDLKLVLAQGTGAEGVDIEAARRRGIAVTNGAGSNATCVGDHAMALLLATVRDIPRIDRNARRSGWDALRVMRPALYGKKLGIVGLGLVGREIAKRAAGFDLEIAYHARRPVEGVAWRHVPVLRDLASWADFLILACPGGPSTFHIVNAEVLDALGPEGFLVNVARGSVVDTGALVAALADGRIAGAGIDVFENEPGVPEALWPLERVVLTPHLAGSAPEVRRAQLDFALANLRALDEGRPLVSRIA